MRCQLENAAKAESKDLLGRTPLLVAVKEGHEVVVRLLLGRGDVDVNSKDLAGRTTPLMAVAERGHEPIAKLLLEQDDVDVSSLIAWYYFPPSGDNCDQDLLLCTFQS